MIYSKDASRHVQLPNAIDPDRGNFPEESMTERRMRPENLRLEAMVDDRQSDDLTHPHHTAHRPSPSPNSLHSIQGSSDATSISSQLKNRPAYVMPPYIGHEARLSTKASSSGSSTTRSSSSRGSSTFLINSASVVLPNYRTPPASSMANRDSRLSDPDPPTTPPMLPNPFIYPALISGLPNIAGLAPPSPPSPILLSATDEAGRVSRRLRSLGLGGGDEGRWLGEWFWQKWGKKMVQERKRKEEEIGRSDVRRVE